MNHSIPALLNASENVNYPPFPKSARYYMETEREFVKEYIFDKEFEGAFLTVDGEGKPLETNDTRKYVITQSNVVLFLKGMDSQSPDESIGTYIDSACNFILDYLKWGAYGFWDLVWFH